MKKTTAKTAMKLSLLPLALFVACADSEQGGGPTPDAGSPDSSTPVDTGAGDANDGGRDVDSLRCSGDFCIVDVPNAAAYGFTKWMFAGVYADPTSGTWAIANGDEVLDESTAQILHFEDDAWKPVFTPTLGSGIEKRNVRLVALAGDGGGQLLAVGSTIDDGTGVVVRGDGTTFTTVAFGTGLEAAWFAAPNNAWLAGREGAVFRSLPDGGWASEAASGGNFVTIWGIGPNDLYVAGARTLSDESFWPEYGYLGHRTVNDAGVRRWTYQSFVDLQNGYPSVDHVVRSGITVPNGGRYWSSYDVFARAKIEAGEEVWVAEPVKPPVAMRSFWAHGPNDIWAVGDIGRLYHFDGTAWADALLVFNGAPIVRNFVGISGTSAGEIFIVGDDVALRRRAP